MLGDYKDILKLRELISKLSLNSAVPKKTIDEFIGLTDCIEAEYRETIFYCDKWYFEAMKAVRELKARRIQAYQRRINFTDYN